MYLGASEPIHSISTLSHIIVGRRRSLHFHLSYILTDIYSIKPTRGVENHKIGIKRQGKLPHFHRFYSMQ